jgi:hypothetical protein
LSLVGVGTPVQQDMIDEIFCERTIKAGIGLLKAACTEEVDPRGWRELPRNHCAHRQRHVQARVNRVPVADPLAAETLFLSKQLALYVERQVRPRRADDATRITLVILSRLIDWRRALRSSSRTR